MKKLVLLQSLVVVFFTSLSLHAQAQRTISDAKITYKIELPAEQAQMDAMMANSTMVQYIRGDLSRIDMSFNVVNYIYITNAKTSTMVTLLDNHGDKYLIRTPKDAFEKEWKTFDNIQFVDQEGTKEIAGYTCKKAIGKMKDGQQFEVYYTTQLVPESRMYNRRFSNLKGLPLEFEIPMKANHKLKVLATKVDLSPVPASVFDIPHGYREISQDELKKLRG
ncbi:GLPGLI family protein [Chitinophaga skermanii]|uniref:GLPGLI family protein n=1 Tax=Chitinophaga skermanii TaxID=331697 RepID=A0A327Q7A0_9BACT|nr:DUF4412 domain-containing protein [Chitinophaga skermanii]RAI99743.1 GLPGLI family protein [Chitinophaga skermanii]